MSGRVHYSEALGVRNIDDEDRFDINCDLLREFFTLRQRYPKRTQVGLEHKLALFIKDMRQKYNHMKNNRPDRIKKLDDIHPGILDTQIEFDAHVEPSDEWQVVFDEWAKNTPEGAIDAFTFPTITNKNVETARSFQEHIIIKTGCYRLFQPSECNPYTSTPGTMQHIVCYLLYPSQMKDTLFDDRQRIFEENVFNGPHPPEKHKLRHIYKGKLFPSEHNPTEIKQLLKEAYDELFPSGDLLDEIKNCKDVKQYD